MNTWWLLDEFEVRDQEEDQLAGNEVQHDGGDHFAGADSRLEEAWEERPCGSTDQAEDHHQGNGNGCWCDASTKEECSKRAADSAHRELPCSTDIEDAGSECNRDAESDKDQRNRGHNTLNDWSQSSCPHLNVAV